MLSLRAAPDPDIIVVIAPARPGSDQLVVNAKPLTVNVASMPFVDTSSTP
jgi:hypothetical protein